MAAPWAKGFYTSKAWRQNSRAYLESVDGLCERCRAKGKLVPVVIVHHRIHLTPERMSDPMMTMAWSNLEALCQDCHNKEHFEGDHMQRYAWGPDGSLLTGE
ncbi:MAG: HNH endonuclease [Anaerolineaceae bacterium]|nr:HNH endonuclease [Anaerolineaceae bacterium]